MAGKTERLYIRITPEVKARLAEAQRIPLRLASQYVQKLHAMHKATPEIDKEIGELFDRISAETMQRDFNKCLTLQQQGVWMLEYAKRIF